MATPTSIAERPKRELKVLSLGMTRTGEFLQRLLLLLLQPLGEAD